MTNTLKSILDGKGYEVTQVPEYTPVTDCLKMMIDLNIGSIVIMDGDEIKGLFTERSAVHNIKLGEMDLDKTPVSEVMRKDFYALKSTSTIEEALKIFTDKRTRHIPIVENKKLIGMVSIGDVTKLIIDAQRSEIDFLSNYISDDHHGIKPE
jgi:CBS domain-containing protein